MNDYIWTLNNLKEFAGHFDPQVRTWACRRALALYADGGLDIFKSLFKDEDETVAAEALLSLRGIADSSIAADVLQLYRQSRGTLGELSAAILAELKEEKFPGLFAEKLRDQELGRLEKIEGLYALGSFSDALTLEILAAELDNSIKQKDTTFLKPVIESLVKQKNGLEPVLRRLSSSTKAIAAEIFSALLGYAHLAFPAPELELIFKKKDPFPVQIGNYLKVQFGDLFAENFAKLFREKKYAMILKSLLEKVEERFRKISPNHSTAKNLTSLSSFQLLDGFRNFSWSGNEKHLRNIVIVSIMLVSKLVEETELMVVNIDKSDDDVLFSILFENRCSYEIDEEIIETLLQRCSRETLIGNAVEQIENEPDSAGTVKAFTLLRRLRASEAIAVMVNWLEKSHQNETCDECRAALQQMGSSLVEFFILNYKKLTHTQKCYLLWVLADIPLAETVDFLLHNWADLWKTDKETFVEALEGVASDRFIAPLRQELVPEELHEEKCYYILCMIHGVEDPILDEIRETMLMNEREFEDLLSSGEVGLGVVLTQPIKAELKCDKCQKNYFYDIETVCVDGDEPEIGDRIVCKNCRAINQYEITAKGKMAIMAYLSILIECQKLGDFDPDSCPLKIVSTGMLGGKKMTTSEIEAFYRKKVAETPNDPGGRIGYGNVLMNQGKELEAVFQFHQALKLDSDAVEAYGSLGRYESEKGNIEKAYEYFKLAFKCMNVARFYRSSDPEGLKDSLVYELQRLEAILGKADHQYDDIAVSKISTPKDAGRNDPCPCGSGRKYKKCCLQ